MTNAFHLAAAGDAAVCLRFEPRIDPAINARAVAAAQGLRDRHVRGVLDVVASYAAVTVYFDPLVVDDEDVRTALEEAAHAAAGARAESGEFIEVPVCYGGEQGPDLPRVATRAGCDEREVIRRHAGPTYRVYMLGFVAGFAYMGTVDPAIAVPRLPSPRASVPARSVGIAGGQTGIYPVEIAGGWHLIGRTPLCPFDPGRSDPFLFAPGDRVRFVPIDLARYLEMDGPA